MCTHKIIIISSIDSTTDSVYLVLQIEVFIWDGWVYLLFHGIDKIDAGKILIVSKLLSFGSSCFSSLVANSFVQLYTFASTLVIGMLPTLASRWLAHFNLYVNMYAFYTCVHIFTAAVIYFVFLYSINIIILVTAPTKLTNTILLLLSHSDLIIVQCINSWWWSQLHWICLKKYL